MGEKLSWGTLVATCLVLPVIDDPLLCAEATELLHVVKKSFHLCLSAMQRCVLLCS